MKPIYMLDQINYPSDLSYGKYEMVFSSKVYDPSIPTVKILIENVVNWEFLHGNDRRAKTEHGERLCILNYSASNLSNLGGFLWVVNPKNSLISFSLELMKKFKNEVMR